jgi:hypothetical protein
VASFKTSTANSPTGRESQLLASVSRPAVPCGGTKAAKASAMVAPRTGARGGARLRGEHGDGPLGSRSVKLLAAMPLRGARRPSFGFVAARSLGCERPVPSDCRAPRLTAFLETSGSFPATFEGRAFRIALHPESESIRDCELHMPLVLSKSAFAAFRVRRFADRPRRVRRANAYGGSFPEGDRPRAFRAARFVRFADNKNPFMLFLLLNSQQTHSNGGTFEYRSKKQGRPGSIYEPPRVRGDHWSIPPDLR